MVMISIYYNIFQIKKSQYFGFQISNFEFWPNIKGSKLKYFSLKYLDFQKVNWKIQFELWPYFDELWPNIGSKLKYWVKTQILGQDSNIGSKLKYWVKTQIIKFSLSKIKVRYLLSWFKNFWCKVFWTQNFIYWIIYWKFDIEV